MSSAGAFIAAFITKLQNKSLSSTLRVDAIEGNNLTLKTEVMSWLVFATSGVVLFFGIVALIGRIYNAHHKIFYCMVRFYIAIANWVHLEEA